MIKDDIVTVTQPRKAKATANWYFWHSSPSPQLPKSLKYNTAMPPEEDAAAKDNKAVTCVKFDKSFKFSFGSKKYQEGLNVWKEADPISDNVQAD